MTLATSPGLVVDPVVSVFGLNCIGPDIRAYNGSSIASATPGTTNTAQYFPLNIQRAVRVTKVHWHNGAVVSGNVDVGVYNLAGTRQFNCGATVQTTINVRQKVDITDVTLFPGRYYLAIHWTSATASFFAMTLAAAAMGEAMGAMDETIATNLPATATFTTFNLVVTVPHFGLIVESAL